MAAMGFTVKGQCVSVSIPSLLMYTAMVVYQAPQTKNWRNIIKLSRALRFRCMDSVRERGLRGRRPRKSMRRYHGAQAPDLAPLLRYPAAESGWLVRNPTEARKRRGARTGRIGEDARHGRHHRIHQPDPAGDRARARGAG